MDSNVPGEEKIHYSANPLKAIRLPDDAPSTPASGPEPGAILGEIQDEPKPIPPKPEDLSTEHMRVLVAEDDPVNSRIVKKRLEKMGHNVYLTVNGEECASAYGETPVDFDVVLMDMQVCSPDVDTRLSY
jgi:hypothetical protein